MTLRRADLIATRDLAREVAEKCDAALVEADELEKQWGQWQLDRKQSYKVNPTPDHRGNTRLSAALRRRSLDLTRALAELRGRNR